MTTNFRKNNYTKEEKELLAKSIPKNATFAYTMSNGRRRTIKGSNLVDFSKETPEPKLYRVICEKIRDYQVRKLQLQQQLFTYDLESLPVKMLSFLMDEKSLKFQINPDYIDLDPNPQELEEKMKYTSSNDGSKYAEYLIERQQRLHSMLRINMLSEKMRNFFKAQKRISMMQNMKDNTKQWDINEVDTQKLETEFNLLDMMIDTPNSKRERQRVETEIYKMSKDLKNVLKVTRDNNKLNKEILENTEKILTRVEELDLSMKKGFQSVLTRIDSLEETLLSAIKDSKKKHILDDLILTETDDRGVWRYGIGELKPLSFTGDGDELMEFWDWNEFQSPLIAWNVFYRVVFYNTYRAIAALITNLLGGESDFTVNQYFQEFGQAIAVWISAIAKLMFSAIKNLTMMGVSLFAGDMKKLMLYGAKLTCSIVMAMCGELMVGYVAHGALGSTLAVFGAGISSSVRGIHRFAFHSICSTVFSILDSMVYFVTGFTVIGGGSYDSFLYTKLRLGIDSVADYMYNLMPNFPNTNVRISVRGMMNKVIGAIMNILSEIYYQCIYWLGTPEPVKAVKDALKEVAENEVVDVEKVIDTAQCVSDNAIKDQLSTVKDYYVNQQSWGDWFAGDPIKLPPNLERYRKWMKLTSVYNMKEFTMHVVTHDGGTLLMLKVNKKIKF